MSETGKTAARKRQPQTGDPARRNAGHRGRRRARKRGHAIRVILILLCVVCLIGAGILAVNRFMPSGPRIIVEYEDLIRSCAAENGLDPAYVASVVMAESSYRPDAVSRVDARGLMQIMPETGEWIAGKLGEEFDAEKLFDPETNLRYGCWYLGWLMRKYSGDKATASAAYFQGHGTVDRWLADPALSKDGLTLSDYGTEATRTYVERILRYYEKYGEIYV